MFSHMFFRIFVFFVSFWFLSPAWADDPAHHTQARLFSGVEGVGQLATIPAGIDLQIEQGWKTYWRMPGEAGLAPVFSWEGSENLKSAEIRWPAPHRFEAFGIDNFGYDAAVTFPVTLTPENPGQPISLRLKLDLLVCSTLCVPETHRLTLSIPAGEAKNSPDHGLLAEAAAKAPDSADEKSFSIENIWLEESDDKKIYLRVNAKASASFGADTDMFVEHPYYIVTSKPGLSYNPVTGRLQLDALVRAYEPLESLSNNLQKSPLVLTVVTRERSFERRAVLDPLPLASAAEPLPQGGRAHVGPAILLLAFLGGLILNLMPCVLPVLSLKILSVLGHGGKDHRVHGKTIFRHFMASAAGIIFSFWLLAGALIALKATGQAIGWGIQFQHPAFLIFLIVILFAFAANMWGLFEIPLPRALAGSLSVRHEQEPTLLGHFLTGAFATLLATPCTAPFLGTAVGFALARDAVDIFAVFTFLGLGLAYPYIVLALLPHLFKYMPKPGKWMVTLRKILALALALTALWLMSVLVTVTTQPTLDEGWTKFDEALIKPAVAEGRTVVVDVTADWCLTCKANKRLVLEQREVKEALSAPNILRLQADWTRRDETIAAYLKKYGKYGIPFNIIHGPGAPEGIILSELLSKKEVLRALTTAAGE